MRRLALPLFAVLLGAAGGNLGASIVQHGAPGGVIPCRVCHGMQLQGQPAMDAPPLAGLPESTTLGALAAIAAGKQGKNFAMRDVARALTPAQSKAVAAYLAGLKRGPTP
jgi:cytochrome c553